MSNRYSRQRFRSSLVLWLVAVNRGHGSCVVHGRAMAASISTLSKPMDNQPSTQQSSGAFPTTDWTQIIAPLQSRDDDAAWAALGEFCRCYWPAIYNFFCRHGSTPDQAEEFTQEFFAARIVKP